MEPGKPAREGPAMQRFREVLKMEVNRLRLAELKQIIVGLQLPKAGNKPEIMARILEWIERLNSYGRFHERDHAVELIRITCVQYRGHCGLPRLVAGLTDGEGGGGGGAGGGGNPGGATAAGAGSWVKSEATAGGHASLATLGRPQQAGGGAGGGSNAPIQCVCGQNATPWDEVVCTQCGMAFHSQCYGPSMRQRNRVFPPACYICLSLKQNPFLKVESTLLKPGRVGQRPKYDNFFRFQVTHEQQKEINPTRGGVKGSKTEGALQVVVRCFPQNLFEMTKGRAAQDASKPPFCPPHCWPLETQLRVNNHPVPIKQRQVYWHGPQRKWKGHSEPVDIYLNCHAGTNTLVLTHSDDKPYVLLIQLVRVVSVEQLFQRVTESVGGLSIAESLDRIKQSFKVCSVDSDAEDEEPMATVTRLSLRCPLGMTPIQTPARGKDCQHLQCFDLDTFLRYNERGAAAGWKCGVCNATLAVDELKVDAFIHDVIKQLQGKETNEDLGAIQIDHQGQWKVFDAAEAAANNRKRKIEAEASVDDDDDNNDDDDDEDTPLATLHSKVPARPAPPTQPTAAAAAAAAGAAAPAQAAPPPAQQPKQVVAIDLTLSSDEEEEEDTQQSSSSVVEVNPHAGGGGGGGGNWAPPVAAAVNRAPPPVMISRMGHPYPPQPQPTVPADMATVFEDVYP